MLVRYGVTLQDLSPLRSPCPRQTRSTYARIARVAGHVASSSRSRFFSNPDGSVLRSPAADRLSSFVVLTYSWGNYTQSQSEIEPGKVRDEDGPSPPPLQAKANIERELSRPRCGFRGQECPRSCFAQFGARADGVAATMRFAMDVVIVPATPGRSAT